MKRQSPPTPYKKFFIQFGDKLQAFKEERKELVKEFNQSEDDSDSALLEQYNKLYCHSRQFIDELREWHSNTKNLIELGCIAQYDPLWKQGTPLKLLDIKDIID